MTSEQKIIKVEREMGKEKNGKRKKNMRGSKERKVIMRGERGRELILVMI